MVRLWRVLPSDRLELVQCVGQRTAGEVTCVAVSTSGSVASGCLADGLTVHRRRRQPDGPLRLQPVDCGVGSWVSSVQWGGRDEAVLAFTTVAGDVVLYDTDEGAVVASRSFGMQAHAVRFAGEDHVAVSFADRSVQLLERRCADLPEVCVFFLKAPALALDVTSGPAKLLIACADQFGNVALLTPMLVEPPESDKVSVEAEESPGEEDWAADDEVDAEAPAAVWATEPPAAEVDVVSVTDDGLPLLHLRGHPRLSRAQQTRTLLQGLQAFGFL
eukprot:TRINITY_DN17571_c0_g1_i1.p1 TRINITY_DN17571_c0_g1~~TRINITY_DN17571_c0_g1_i1.p1  ORF type:complete len:299 (-),score=63.94 TRINITY_DN17571_c0_g1_i1:141-962(-)